MTGADPWPVDEDIRQRLLENQHPSRPQEMDGEIWELLTHCWKEDPFRRKSALVIQDVLKKVHDKYVGR